MFDGFEFEVSSIGDNLTVRFEPERYPVVAHNGKAYEVRKLTVDGATNPETGRWIPVRAAMMARLADTRMVRRLRVTLDEPFAVELADRLQAHRNGFPYLMSEGDERGAKKRGKGKKDRKRKKDGKRGKKK